MVKGSLGGWGGEEDRVESVSLVPSGILCDLPGRLIINETPGIWLLLYKLQ